MNQANRGDGELFDTYHKGFHMALLGACQSPILLRFCDQLYDLNVRYRFLAGKSKSYARRDVQSEHLKIMQAAVNRDVETLCGNLMEHYRNTGAFLADQIA